LRGKEARRESRKPRKKGRGRRERWVILTVQRMRGKRRNLTEERQTRIYAGKALPCSNHALELAPRNEGTVIRVRGWEKSQPQDIIWLGQYSAKVPCQINIIQRNKQMNTYELLIDDQVCELPYNPYFESEAVKHGRSHTYYTS
jgi:hypothetical protein